jgi:alanine racemase
VTTLAARAVAGPTLSVDLRAVADNVRRFAGLTPGALMAVVKADGFGHGAVDVAQTALAHGASWLGVTTVREAVALRESGLRSPMLSWLNPVDADFQEARRLDVDVAVPSEAHLRAVAAAGLAARVACRIHLHLDVGMARDGASLWEWERLCQAARAAERSGAVRVVGLMGHLGRADSPGHPANAKARSHFAWGVRIARSSGLRPPLRHLAATAATLTDPAARHNLSRVGAGLVGIDPSGTTPLSPALTLSAPVVGVRRVAAGTPVGYGGSWQAPRPTTLALLPVGYADGVPRAASGRAEVLLRGRRRPIVGVVSMDQVVVDLGDDDAQLGEPAIIFGPGLVGEPTVADWATWAGTIEHEIVTGIGARVPRTVVRS